MSACLIYMIYNKIVVYCNMYLSYTVLYNNIGMYSSSVYFYMTLLNTVLFSAIVKATSLLFIFATIP